MDRTCYYVSPSHVGLAVPDFETAGEKCRQMGSALYEPRTRRGMTMIMGVEMDSGDDELHDYAIGMRVDDEGELADGERGLVADLSVVPFSATNATSWSLRVGVEDRGLGPGLGCKRTLTAPFVVDDGDAPSSWQSRTTSTTIVSSSVAMLVAVPAVLGLLARIQRQKNTTPAWI